MSEMKTKVVKAQDSRCCYIVPDVGVPSEPAVVLASADPQSGMEDGLVDVSVLRPLMVKADGEFLAAVGDGGPHGFVIAKAPCGAAGDCGCGCDHGWRVTRVALDRAVVWAHGAGARHTGDLPEELVRAWTGMLV